MLFLLKAKISGHVVSASVKTAEEAFAKAVEWQMRKQFADVVISDGFKNYSLAEFSAAVAHAEIAATAEAGAKPSEPSTTFHRRTEASR